MQTAFFKVLNSSQIFRDPQHHISSVTDSLCLSFKSITSFQYENPVTFVLSLFSVLTLPLQADCNVNMSEADNYLSQASI